MHIILADDHTLFREGLASLLQRKLEISKVYEADDVAGLLAHIERPVHFSLILVDYTMPGMEGMATVRRIVELSARPVVVISAIGDRSLIRELFHSGVAGFIPKTARSELMIGALQLVLSGGIYVPDILLDVGEAEPADIASLSERQIGILRQIAEGKSNREIASSLNISEHTVRVHITALMKIYGAANRTRLVMLVRSRGHLLI